MNSGLLCPPNKAICYRWLRVVHRVKGSSGGCSQLKLIASMRKKKAQFPLLFTVLNTSLLPSVLGSEVSNSVVSFCIPRHIVTMSSPDCYAKLAYLVLGYRLPSVCTPYTNKNIVPTDFSHAKSWRLNPVQEKKAVIGGVFKPP